MVTIEITKRGVYDQSGAMMPIGTRLQFAKEPTGWAGKYRVVVDVPPTAELVVNPAPAPRGRGRRNGR